MAGPAQASNRRLRIAVHDYSGHPFQAQLSRELARRGHSVLHVHCSSYRTGKGAVERNEHDPPDFAVDEIALEETFEKYSPVKRIRQEREYARRLTRRLLAWSPDVVISSNTPLFAQSAALPVLRRTGTRFVFWQQDIYSLAMSAVARRRIPIVGGSLGRRFMAMERRLLLQSDAVVAIAEDFLDVLRSWGIPEGKLHVIENWAPLNELPVLPRDNAWAREHRLEQNRVLLYSGTLGLKHNPELLLRLAADFRGVEDVRVVVVSEGRGAEWLEARIREHPLANLILLPFQPYARLAEVHASADVLLALLEPEAGRFSVPSKILTYLCAQRPVLAALPKQNLAARTLVRTESGLVVDPSDPGAWLAAARLLLNDPDLRAALGAAGRRYAETAFDIQHVGDRFEDVIGRVTGRHAVATGIGGRTTGE